ncbi:MAG: hypothetical protein ACK4MF_02895 [Hyphomicrobiaceae bacterium]
MTTTNSTFTTRLALAFVAGLALTVLMFAFVPFIAAMLVSLRSHPTVATTVGGEVLALGKATLAAAAATV